MDDAKERSGPELARTVRRPVRWDPARWIPSGFRPRAGVSAEEDAELEMSGRSWGPIQGHVLAEGRQTGEPRDRGRRCRGGQGPGVHKGALRRPDADRPRRALGPVVDRCT